jgi:hypothetical protein
VIVRRKDLGLKNSERSKFQAGENVFEAQPAEAMGNSWFATPRVNDPQEWMIFDQARPPNAIGILRAPDYTGDPWQFVPVDKRERQQAARGKLATEIQESHDPRQMVAVASAFAAGGSELAARVRATFGTPDEAKADPPLFTGELGGSYGDTARTEVIIPPDPVPAPPIEVDAEPGRDEMRRHVVAYDANGDVVGTQEVVIRRGELARAWLGWKREWGEPKRVSGISHKRNAITLGPKGRYDTWLSPQEVCPESFFAENPGCTIRPPQAPAQALVDLSQEAQALVDLSQEAQIQEAQSETPAFSNTPKKPKKTKAPKAAKPPKPPKPARGRAREQYIDPITGEPVPSSTPGAIASGGYIVRTRPRKGSPLVTVPIDPDELGAPTYEIEITAQQLAERARTAAEALRDDKKLERELGALKGKQAIPGVAETFRNAGSAARKFLELNEGYYSPIAAGLVDFGDASRDWADTQEVWVPRKGRGKGSAKEQGYMARLIDTKKGQRVLGVGIGAGTGGFEARLLAILTWIFSQTASKRWAEVDWHRIEALNDRIDEAIEQNDLGPAAARARGGQQTPTYPAASGIYTGSELIAHPSVQASPRARATVEANVNLERLSAVRARLQEAYKAGRSCLPPDVRRAVNRRLRYLKELERHPIRISTAAICAHARSESSAELLAALEEGGGAIQDRELACTFPLLVEDSDRLARVCEDGYSADWPTEEVAAWEADPYRHELQLEATPLAVRRRAPAQDQAPTFDEALDRFDQVEEDMFGPAVDEEIPF